jgi:hypothetical protein
LPNGGIPTGNWVGLEQRRSAEDFLALTILRKHDQCSQSQLIAVAKSLIRRTALRYGSCRKQWRRNSSSIGNVGWITEHTRLTADIKLPELTRDSFIDLYPLLPYQIDLIIQVVSGLRTQSGASKHVGGANRTIIKLASPSMVERSSMAT